MLSALRLRFSGVVDSIIRFPTTVAFLLAAAVLTAISIGQDNHLIKFILTCAVGAISCATFQAAYERFTSGVFWRIILTIGGLLVTVLFYLSIWTRSENGPELITRTAVTMFALFIAFNWIAVVGSRYSFNESFMAAFKAFFQSAFFSGIIFLGCAAIIAAIDQLIVPIDSEAYAHTANIVFVIFAPLFFLSLIPVYPARAIGDNVPTDKLGEIVIKRTYCPKFLEVLLSYIIVPLASVFTVILLIYIFLNIGGRFWTDNLLEPMLIAYTVTVIVVTVLIARLENKFAILFRKIFPKVLIPIALFQTVASFLVMTDTGVTFSRYFVIVYGLFAVLSGVVLSFMALKKSGMIAVALIVLSTISLVPPVDAFTVSRSSQIRSLEAVLINNDMLSDNVVRPNSAISDADKTQIISSLQYLGSMEELGSIEWLPADFNQYDDNDFYNTFGFRQYIPSDPGYRYISVYYDISGIIPVSGFDFFTQVGLPDPYQSSVADRTFAVGGETYSLEMEDAGSNRDFVIKNAAGLEIIRFSTEDIFSRYISYSSDKNILTLDEATFAVDNTAAALKIIVTNANLSTEPNTADRYAQMILLVKIK